jgi:exonuclease SbcD
MNFSFLHAADLHLGSPLLGLTSKDEAVARRFAAANREAFSELVRQAIEEKVAFVLLAGDLFDGEWKDASIGLFFNKEMARLARAEIPVFSIRGNHDAETEVTRAVPLPPTVHEFSTRSAETKTIDSLKVALHGRGFADRAVVENISLRYPKPVEGWFNIGLLHTSCEGHAAHATYAPCSTADLVRRQYQYWALGHVHEHAVLHRDPWIVYPGNLQGRSIRECGPKGAVIVDVRDGRIADLRRLIVDRARWVDVRVDVSRADRLDTALGLVRDALANPLHEASGRMAAVRVTLSGASALHGQLLARVDDLRDEVQARIDHIHEEAWLEALKIRTEEPAIAGGIAGTGLDPASMLTGLEQDAELRAKAQDLLAMIRNKLPANLPTDDLDDLDAIFRDARALAVGRATGPEC